MKLALAQLCQDVPGYDRTLWIQDASHIRESVADVYAGLDREAVVALALDVKHRIIARYVVAIGHLCGCPVHPRELFKEAVRRSAAAVVVVHNHPSGDVSPSADDLALTSRLRKAGEILGIELVDHVIVDGACEGYLSIRDSYPWSWT